jgi:hypothetical protein
VQDWDDKDLKRDALRYEPVSHQLYIGFGTVEYYSVININLTESWFLAIRNKFHKEKSCSQFEPESCTYIFLRRDTIVGGDINF